MARAVRSGPLAGDLDIASLLRVGADRDPPSLRHRPKSCYIERIVLRGWGELASFADPTPESVFKN